MRIALVTTEFVTEPLFDGGLSNYLMRLCLSLIQLGHTPIIIVTSDHDEIIFHRGIEVHRVNAIFRESRHLIAFPLLQKFFRTYLYLQNSRKLNKYLLKNHTQNPFNIVQYTHLMGLGLFRIKKIPSVIRLSSNTQACMDAHEIKGSRQQFLWEELAMLRADGLFGPSQIVSSILGKKLHKEVRVIESPFIMDVESEDTRVYKNNLEGKKYFLFFGTISLLKGVTTIAKALKPIFQKYSNIQFVFVGKDNLTPDGDPLVPLLFDSAEEFRGRVIYLGNLHHEELYPIIRHANIVILPSRIDNFPNTCIEAMAFKKIVIGTHGTSFEQLIEDGKSGFLCEIDDVNSLLETIEKVMRLTPHKKEIIGLNASLRISKLEPKIVVNELLNFYTEIINRKYKR